MRTCERMLFAIVIFLISPFAPVGRAQRSQGAKPALLPSGQWDSATVTARFDGVLLDENKHLLFFYVLQNNSDKEYLIPAAGNARLFAMLSGSQLSQELSSSEMYLAFPIQVHPHQVQVIELRDYVHSYTIKQHLKENPTDKEYHAYEIEAYGAVRKSWPDLKGFRLYDVASQKMIELPRGW